MHPGATNNTTYFLYYFLPSLERALFTSSNRPAGSMVRSAKNTWGKVKQDYFKLVANVTDILIFLMYYLY